MHLLVDNYDSFTYNIYQALGELGAEVKVFRNDRIGTEDAQALKPESLIISPGPGVPRDAGRSTELVRLFAGVVPILGVCLGHQCIIESFGGKIERADRVMHGKISNVYHDGKTIFDGLSNPFCATRYHSLIAREDSIPDELEVTAYTSEGEIMGVRAKGLPVEGVQFHPESILTPEGKRMFMNFLEAAGSN
jgi:para-aminobenzoate synthetase component 2